MSREETGMKQSEIEKCATCGQGVGHSNQLMFYQIKSRYMMLDIAALRRADGMEQMMGGGNFGAMIQQTMGRDEDLAKEVSSHSICVCLQCSMRYPLTALIQLVIHEEEKVAVDAEGPDQIS